MLPGKGLLMVPPFSPPLKEEVRVICVICMIQDAFLVIQAVFLTFNPPFPL